MSETGTLFPGLVPMDDFAQLCNRSRRTVKRWENAGQLVVVRLGGQRLVDVQKSRARIRGEDRPRGRGRK